ncbi:MAG: hypothetical protein A3C93_00085 [Candidatus Lloydbacteria bacterium RIFCSPHIGHO2_02_FULL_54_17]|uniref:DUF35 domain-containing protein n=1 Tax=Candidatus Lloydbacteria bacterium RIFCSPHIGHO2_02_FULL_54_17 TaxID=1798664 RepID=A0A1G2DIR3_9BACT|nr:MAG: hypothetical protein A2762_03835 [Candidatus Lloydbacteria bacterium RIFCSPHIGHO2_01_FULL_54_11]OGZ13302.1 MAG: hypothetical protein A3C93_00085 [Candidatus Lloydbacteria bacterium RIFCSPHIGHO2_02_FULL_54_17]OGZ17110.1 MAG: hypothetical protein A3H76_02885 [Candidatus Lloydbacteria bacterium RIFCSPLOWO2_02_FULL_54_12]
MKKTTKERQKVALLSRRKVVLAENLFREVVPSDVIVRENPRTVTHRHTYGGLSKFFLQLTARKLYGTKCRSTSCAHTGIWLPPRVHCPDCWEKMCWVEIDTSGAKVYTHSMTNLPGAGFMLSTPCPLISVEIPGVCTKFMSYLSKFGEGEPYIGMPVKPVFRTRRPTYTILDVSWVPNE